MSKGIVIIANNTKDYDYVSLAECSARLAKKHLNLPATLLTNSDCASNEFEQIIRIDPNLNNFRTLKHGNHLQKYEWLNLNRTDVYELSPYDRTILIDADFLILTDALRPHIDANFDFAIAESVHNPTQAIVVNETLTSNRPISLRWATIVIFNKSLQAKNIFCLTKHIIENYASYAKIYDFDVSPIRNDYAFSLAVHILAGYGLGNLNLKNYSMTTVNFNDTIYDIRENKQFVIQYMKNDIAYLQRLGRSDIHFLNKNNLLENLPKLELL